ncbi:hypothetical protein PG987_014973 [Apiospora arundinis]
MIYFIVSAYFLAFYACFLEAGEASIRAVAATLALCAWFDFPWSFPLALVGYYFGQPLLFALGFFFTAALEVHGEAWDSFKHIGIDVAHWAIILIPGYLLEFHPEHCLLFFTAWQLLRFNFMYTVSAIVSAHRFVTAIYARWASRHSSPVNTPTDEPEVVLEPVAEPVPVRLDTHQPKLDWKPKGEHIPSRGRLNVGGYSRPQAPGPFGEITPVLRRGRQLPTRQLPTRQLTIGAKAQQNAAARRPLQRRMRPAATQDYNPLAPNYDRFASSRHARYNAIDPALEARRRQEDIDSVAKPAPVTFLRSDINKAQEAYGLGWIWHLNAATQGVEIVEDVPSQHGPMPAFAPAPAPVFAPAAPVFAHAPSVLASPPAAAPGFFSAPAPEVSSVNGPVQFPVIGQG